MNVQGNASNLVVIDPFFTTKTIFCGRSRELDRIQYSSRERVFDPYNDFSSKRILEVVEKELSSIMSRLIVIRTID